MSLKNEISAVELGRPDSVPPSDDLIEDTGIRQKTPQEETASAVVEPVEGGVHRNFLPGLLITFGIRGAMLRELKNGRYEISARTTREKLLAALRSIRGVKLAEA